MKPKTTRTTGLALALGLGIGTHGCATILHGTHQDVDVTSESPTAALTVDGDDVERGPVELSRDSSHHVTAEEPNGRRVAMTIHSRLSWGYTIVDSVIAVLFFPIGLIFPVVDLFDGAAFDLDPERVVLPSPYEHDTRGLPPDAQPY